MSIFGKNATPKNTDDAARSHERHGRFAPYLKWGLIGMACAAVIALIISFGSGGNNGNDYVATIEYYANGGKFSGSSSVKKTLGVGAGDCGHNLGSADEPIVNGSLESLERNGYTFRGWYTTYSDEEGNLIYENGEIKLGTEYLFDTPLEEGQALKLAAKWERMSYVSVRLAGCDIADTDGKTYAVGTVLRELNFENGKAQKYTGSRLVDFDKQRYMFAEYYLDEACTQTVSWPIRAAEGQDDYTVYAKFIEGNDWTLVTKKSEAVAMFAELDSDKKYYLTTDIDMGGAVVSTNAIVSAVIEGNGFTISDFSVSRSNESVSSMFGTLGAAAQIHDLTLEDITLTANYKGGAANVYFLFAEIEDGAEVSGLTARGTVQINGNAYIGNIQSLAPWIIGTDETLLKNRSVTVEATCTIDGITYQYPSEQG